MPDEKPITPTQTVPQDQAKRERGNDLLRRLFGTRPPIVPDPTPAVDPPTKG